MESDQFQYLKASTSMPVVSVKTIPFPSVNVLQPQPNVNVHYFSTINPVKLAGLISLFTLM